ncbi:MAG: ribosome biogenesis GTP-binding protein YihA/YsxC [Clostridiales bacterium]|jgi:GTP-binding protein|nr:ribosome biogenesis GTP-binding protein YihA/YsxC [Clostridiales bacterium]
MIKAKSASFLYSRIQFENTSESEVAFIGRSNVGKSSLINMITGIKGLAKSSSTPGRTKLINYFELQISDDVTTKKVYLVDLPGYGFAKTSKREREDWNKMIDNYLTNTHRLKLCLLLTDSRLTPMKSDILAANYLYALQLPFVIIGAKAEKFNKSKLMDSQNNISTSFKVGRDDIVMTSALSGMGKEALLQKIFTCLD